MKILPKTDDRRKYIKRSSTTEYNHPSIKKPRLELDAQQELDKQTQAIEANREFILENLNKNNCIQLVMNGLYKVPDAMPLGFVKDYNESTKGRPSGDLKTIAKLLAEQFLDAGVGPGSKIAGKRIFPTEIQRNESMDSKSQNNDVAEEKDKVSRPF